MRTHVRAMTPHASAFSRRPPASAALTPFPPSALSAPFAPLAQTPYRLALGAALLAACACNARAADGAPTLNTTVVTASRTEQKLVDTLASTSVITREQIEQSQAQDLPTLLRGQAGVEIAQNGGFGASASIFMRGAASNASLVLIDGVPVNSATTGTTNIAQIPVSQIDHIEIVRGNVSALYGSQAVGGVIQIFTRHGDGGPPRAYAELGYSTNNTTQANAGIAGSFEDGKTRFSLDISRFHTNGISAQDPRFAPKVNPNRNGDDNTSVTATLSRKFGSTWEAGVRLFQSDGSISYDNAFGKPSDLNDTDARVRQISAYAKGKITDKWSTRLTVTQGDDYNYNYLNGAGNGNYHTSSHQIDWANEYAFMPDQKLIAGYTRQEQTVESSTKYDRNNRHLDSFYVGYEGVIADRHEVQATVRRDMYSDFGGANSYWVGYGYRLTDQWKLMANASDGFRAPTFNELFYPGFGNPNLQPERSISKELAVQFYDARFGLAKLALFRTNYTNLIQSLTVYPYTAANVANARVEGLELTYQGKIQWTGTDVRASFTRQNPTDLDAGKVLARRARQYGSFGVTQSLFGKFSVGGDVFYSGERYDTGGQHLGAYALFNLQARYDIDKSWYVSAHLDNVFNKQYQTVYGYNTLGRAIYVSLGWKQF
ncbi:TonB-dependent receptor [Pandoraea faecigallinarum]|uniref:TonB-dependent receptor n=1 Tax=Pandoraea faecigallinarum TaxID=656179 RepID=A0A0H3WZ78_9BURK|nr:TonB-dependent receptor [Pandoraea faecigallinarum]AKM32950.2 TonB-dependent receptor [Pandoraea faecigallinarum]